MVLFPTCVSKKFQDIFILFCISLCFHMMGKGGQIYLWEVHLKCMAKQAFIRELKKERIENMPVIRPQEQSPLPFKLKQKERHEESPE